MSTTKKKTKQKQQQQQHEDDICIDVEQNTSNNFKKDQTSMSTMTGSNAKSHNKENVKIYKAYHDSSLDCHIKNICWMVVFIACFALVLVLVLCSHPELLKSNDKIHILAVVLPIYGMSMVALFFVRKETKALLVVIVILALVIGYLLAYTSQSVMKRSEINCTD